ncbi:MAG: 8-oxo-dGTP diphosphatase [Acidobacteria bacterium]|nr:MAG: 8-oxo-dGTP diphosphatase [Acidobacteriota bacterium]
MDRRAEPPYALHPVPRTVAAIDWRRWQPTDRATLLFVVRGGQVLLIRKKRGLGAGKVNGPGGRLENGESPRDCALREVHEEVGVEATGVADHGELSFQFADGYAIHVFVFRADGCRGEARETAEAIPLWTDVERIPYDEMWADDRIWLPLLLAGRRFRGRFVFDGDRMLDHHLETLD